jgi:hypothetical protein
MLLSLQVIKSSRGADPLFRFSISSRYAPHFREAQLDHTSTPLALEHVLAHLSHFPNLERLSLSCKATLLLLGNPLSLQDDPAASLTVQGTRSAFLTLTGRIETLVLDEFKVNQAARILAPFTKVRSLSLQGAWVTFEDNVTQQVALATVLAGLEGLESLSINKQDPTDPVSFKIPNCWTAAKWGSASSLRRLVLEAHTFTREDALFVAHFPNLEALSLSLSDTSVDFPVADKQKPQVTFILFLIFVVTLCHIQSFASEGSPHDQSADKCRSSVHVSSPTSTQHAHLQPRTVEKPP